MTSNARAGAFISKEMILTVLHSVLEWRHLPASFVIFTSSTNYTVIWTALKVATAPLGRKVFHRAEDVLYSSYQWMLAFFFEKYSGVEFVFYGDPLPEKDENVLYLSNHQSTVDWVLAEQLALRAGSGGVVRYILKDSLRYIPLYGYFLKQHGCVYIHRHGTDQDHIARQLRRLVSEERQVWLCLFVEGTRFTPSKGQQSRTFAASRTLPQYRHLLLPKTKGFEVCLDSMSDYLHAVYDITILYEGVGPQGRLMEPPHLFNFFSGRWKKVHIHVHRTAISAVPSAPHKRRQWLYDRFSEKDQWLEMMKSGRNGDAHSDMPRPRSLPLPLSHSLPMTLLAVAGILGFRWKWPFRVVFGSLAFYTVLGWMEKLLAKK